MKHSKNKKLLPKQGDELEYRPPDLIQAVIDGKIEKVREALTFDPTSILKLDRSQMSALHWAAATGKYEIAEILFSQALVKRIQFLKDNRGLEPMQHALSSASDRTISMFRRNLYPEFIGHETDPYGKTPRVTSLHPSDPENN